MLRLLALGLLAICSFGCLGTTDTDYVLYDVPVSPETKKGVEDLVHKLQHALQNKDWAAVAALYWSGAQMTPEKAQEEYEEHVDEAGSMQTEYLQYVEYDANNLSEDVGEDVLQKIGAPNELWRGFADISYADPMAGKGLELTLEVGEENGKFVILGIEGLSAFEGE